MIIIFVFCSSVIADQFLETVVNSVGLKIVCVQELWCSMMV